MKKTLFSLAILFCWSTLFAATPPPMQYNPWSTNRAGPTVFINGAQTHLTNNQYDDLLWLGFGNGISVVQSGTGFNKTNTISVDTNSASFTNLNASLLNSGTIPDGRYGTPTFNGASVTNLNASQLSSGTIPNGRYGNPQFNGAGITNISTIVTNYLATNAPVSNAQFTNIVGITLTTGNWLITINGLVGQNGATYTSTLWGIGIGTKVDGSDLNAAGEQYIYNSLISTDVFKGASISDYVTVTTASTNYYFMNRLNGYSVAVPNIWASIIAIKQP